MTVKPNISKKPFSETGTESNWQNKSVTGVCTRFCFWKWSIVTISFQKNSIMKIVDYRLIITHFTLRRPNFCYYLLVIFYYSFNTISLLIESALNYWWISLLFRKCIFILRAFYLFNNLTKPSLCEIAQTEICLICLLITYKSR